MADTETPQKALCVVRGSINIDEFFHVPNIVLPGQTLSSTKYEVRAGGKGANQAVAIAKAGQKVKFVGAIGSDGWWLVDGLKKNGVLTENVAEASQASTGRAIIQLSPDGENSIVLLGGANTDVNAQESCTSLHATSAHTHLLVQNEIPWSATRSALHTSHSKFGATTFFNPSPLPTREQVLELSWDDVDWLVVNEGEAQELLDLLQGDNPDDLGIQIEPPPTLWPEEEVIGYAYATLQLLRALPFFRPSVNLVCTLGGTGVVVLPAGDPTTPPEPIFVPAAKLGKPLVDTTGAGDCFTGYLVSGFMKHWDENWGKKLARADLEEIVKVSAKAAGICVTRMGASESIPTYAELN